MQAAGRSDHSSALEALGLTDSREDSFVELDHNYQKTAAFQVERIL